MGGTKDGGIIENCYIGVDSTENAKLPNGAQGIYVSSGRTNLTITGNVISGNGTYGIDNAGTSRTVITDNLIGVGQMEPRPLAIPVLASGWRAARAITPSAGQRRAR